MVYRIIGVVILITGAVLATCSHRIARWNLDKARVRYYDAGFGWYHRYMGWTVYAWMYGMSFGLILTGVEMLRE